MKRMVLAALLLFANCAWASQVFELAFTGMLTHSPDGWECLDCPPGGLLPVELPWAGTVTVTTSSGMDGTYAQDSGLLSFSIQSNVGDYMTSGYNPGGLTATVEEGLLTLSNGVYNQEARYSFNGTQISYDQAQLHHYGPTVGVGTLTPVPEPSTWAMLFGGVFLAFAMRKHQRPKS